MLALSTVGSGTSAGDVLEAARQLHLPLRHVHQWRWPWASVCAGSRVGVTLCSLARPISAAATFSCDSSPLVISSSSLEVVTLLFADATLLTDRGRSSANASAALVVSTRWDVGAAAVVAIWILVSRGRSPCDSRGDAEPMPMRASSAAAIVGQQVEAAQRNAAAGAATETTTVDPHPVVESGPVPPEVVVAVQSRWGRLVAPRERVAALSTEGHCRCRRDDWPWSAWRP